VGLAAVIFGESPSPLQLGGVALVLGALLTATRPVRPARGVRPGEVPEPALE
jgi:drug/metabolite transporter (DMT)-like permease